MIIRSKRTQNFTVIPNMVLEDKSLDWKALGLLVYLLSKPDDWSVSVPQLVKAKKAGEDAIRGMLKALRDAGYVEMKRAKTGEVDWLVYDTPRIGKTPNRENPDEAQESKATSGKSLTGKIPNGENPDVLIKTDKELLKTEKDNQIPFDDFYSAYPKKVKRKDAERKWKLLSPEKQLEAINGIARFAQGKEPQFICAPDVYINGERWNDEPVSAQKSNAPASQRTFAENQRIADEVEKQQEAARQATQPRNITPIRRNRPVSLKQVLADAKRGSK